MNGKPIAAVLLFVACAAGCRCGRFMRFDGAPRDPFADVLPTVETREFPVSEILESFSAVPRPGVCVLPLPVDVATVVEFPASWLTPEGVAAQPAGTGTAPPAVTAAPPLGAEPAGSARIPRSSSLFEEPGQALVTHLRSKLAAKSRTERSVALVVRGGNVLEARGSTADLDAVARALADLRREGAVRGP